MAALNRRTTQVFRLREADLDVYVQSRNSQDDPLLIAIVATE